MEPTNLIGAGGVDLAPLMNELIPFLGVILMALAGWATKWLAAKLKLSADSEIRSYLMNYIGEAVSYGESRARELSGTGKFTINVKNEAIKAGLGFVTSAAPTAIAKLNFTPEDLRQLIEAKLPTAEQ